MPCYEVRTMSVEFQAQHKGLLIKALTNLGWGFTEHADRITLTRENEGIEIDLRRQEAKLEEWQQSKLNQLKRAYSSAALDRVAKMNMWTRKSETETRGVLRRF